MREIILIAHNIRSTYNVGSLLRTAEGLGVKQVYLLGYTPYPKIRGDKRLPHISKKMHNQIIKTSLGAEKNLQIKHCLDIDPLITKLKSSAYKVIVLEQSNRSIKLAQYKPSRKIVLIVGSEVGGVDAAIIKLADKCIQIPMLGQKESFNVSIAAAIAMYHIRFNNEFA